MVKVFLVCSGLGHVKRGFESFTRECFDVLSQVEGLNITLFQGGGQPSEKEITLWNLARNQWITKQISKFIGEIYYPLKEPYITEQFSFFFSLLPYIYFGNPDVIYFRFH